jgi:hypothetical protein
MTLVEGQDQGQVMLPYPPSARELIQLYFGRQIRLRIQESDVSVGTTAIKLGSWANTRVALTIGNTGSALVVVGFNSNVTVTTGLPVQPNTGLTFNWFLDNELVMYDLYAISGSSGQTIHVIESVLSPA